MSVNAMNDAANASRELLCMESPKKGFDPLVTAQLGLEGRIALYSGRRKIREDWLTLDGFV